MGLTIKPMYMNNTFTMVCSGQYTTLASDKTHCHKGVSKEAVCKYKQKIRQLI